MDFRQIRHPITGEEQELRVGVGNKFLTLKGGMVIGATIGLLMLCLQGYLIREFDRQLAELRSTLLEELKRRDRLQEELQRLSICVLTLNAAEREYWRQSKNPREALLGYCPYLLYQSGPTTP